MKEKDDGWIAFLKANPSFAPILFFLFILALVTAPIHPQICAESEEYPCKYVIRENLLTGFFYYANAYSGAIVAFFTATLWGSAIWQGRLTRDSINLAREEFVATHRPLISVRGITLIPPSETKKTANIMFIIHNDGSSLAKIIEINFYMCGKEPGEYVWPAVTLQTPTLPFNIRPGYREWTHCQAAKEIWEFWPEESLAITFTPFLEFRIIVDYEDTMGARRQTSAHRQYDFGESRFRHIADSEFEYQT